MTFKTKMMNAMVCGFLLTGSTVMANERSDTKRQDADYALQPQVQAFIDDLVKNEHFSKQELEQVLGQAKKSDRVLELISRPAEKRLEWKDYRKIFMTEKRINMGVDFWSTHAETLSKAEKEYGVPAEIIVAIIGVETYYGRLTGGFKVLDALSTLSFDYPPRSRFFTKQLKEFLILARDQKLDVDELTGSYAGAMGIPQFMPSSYRAYAVDYTRDGKSDIWQEDDDAIASVANYLKENGWKRGNPIASQAHVSGSTFKKVVSSSTKPEKTIEQLKASGWGTLTTLPLDSKASALTFEGDGGTEYWIGLDNFYVITTYNRSKLYALAVLQLAREVESEYNAMLAEKKSTRKKT